MPSKVDHLSQAEKNETVSLEIAVPGALSARSTDWEVTTLFYSALHFVDAFLDHSQSIHPQNHKDRRQWVSNASQLKPISKHYLELYDRSQDVRYLLLLISPAQVSYIYTDCFQPIKSHIKGLLNVP